MLLITQRRCRTRCRCLGRGDAVRDAGDDEEAHANVGEGEKLAVLGVGSAVAEEPGSLEGNLTNLGDGIPDACLLYTSPSPRDATLSRMPSSA